MYRVIVTFRLKNSIGTKKGILKPDGMWGCFTEQTIHAHRTNYHSFIHLEQTAIAIARMDPGMNVVILKIEVENLEEQEDFHIHQYMAFNIYCNDCKTCRISSVCGNHGNTCHYCGKSLPKDREVYPDNGIYLHFCNQGCSFGFYHNVK